MTSSTSQMHQTLEHSLWPTTPTPYPQFLLFGDSITQMAEPTLLAPLRDSYIRRMDLVNRGFGGYTSSLALSALPLLFPSSPPSPTTPHIRLMMLYFGTNDACLPGNAQHVPLTTYASNLRAIISHPLLQGHATKVVLVVPGPIDEWQLQPLIPGDPRSGTSRTAANAKRYAEAAREVGRSEGVVVLDLWTLFMGMAGWKTGGGEAGDDERQLPGAMTAPKNDMLASLLSDGIHFTPFAYKAMHHELVRVISAQLPEEMPDRLPLVFPEWDRLLGWDKLTGTRRA